MSLKEVINDAVAAVKDLSSLQIQTFSVDDMKVFIDGTNPVDFDKLMETAKTAGTLQLQYTTKIDIDGDTVELVPSSPPPDHIIEAHKSATEAAENARASIISLFKDLID